MEINNRNLIEIVEYNNIIKDTNEGQLLTNKYLMLSRNQGNKLQTTKKNHKNTQTNQKNNVTMRRHHRIQQPGFDVQRFGHK